MLEKLRVYSTIFWKNLSFIFKIIPYLFLELVHARLAIKLQCSHTMESEIQCSVT